ncbi:MAG: hypothetical protein AB7U52_01115 [Candidatus Izemoplasmatales bacterium]|jgi:thiol-disulfide isomerase/thioredoxin
MATYKKGFKKQNTEMLLLKTIVAVIVAVILVVLVAFIYDSITKWRDYSNYDTITKYEDAFAMKDADGVELSDYVIYVYSDTCEGCVTIKNDLLKIANKFEDDKFFLMNISSMTDEDIDAAKVDFQEIIERTVSTPMLITVNDGDFEELFVGSTAVVETLTLIEQNTYAPFLD